MSFSPYLADSPFSAPQAFNEVLDSLTVVTIFGDTSRRYSKQLFFIIA